MYKRFYGLKKNPFELSPDPYFFYATPRHKEALGSLHYGVQRHKGFSVMTGQAGTGKTLIIRCLAEFLKRANVSFAYFFNPQLTAADFVEYILSDLGLPVPPGGKSAKLFALNDYLVDQHLRGSTTVLIVDEAHLLSRELLEEIRLLTNLETPREKLLQIILSGQPELDAIIDSPDMPQLKQRIALRCRLRCLHGAEVETYILRRLERASVAPRTHNIFSIQAIAAIEKYSQGIPRLMNTICENSLVSGYALQLPVVNASIVEEVAGQFGFLAAAHTSADADSNCPPAKAEPREVFSGVSVAQALTVARRSSPAL